MSAELFVALAFFIFMGILAYAGVHKTLIAGIDNRAARIAKELGEAQRLREEAAKLLAEFEKKRAAATVEADEIIAAAKAEAEMMRKDAQVRLEEMIARRTQQAETRIAMAEQQATAEVRAAAADLAVKAAGQILGATAPAEGFSRALGEVKAKLNA